MSRMSITITSFRSIPLDGYYMLHGVERRVFVRRLKGSYEMYIGKNDGPPEQSSSPCREPNALDIVISVPESQLANYLETGNPVEALV
jgi:hypothetical protein